MVTNELRTVHYSAYNGLLKNEDMTYGRKKEVEWLANG